MRRLMALVLCVSAAYGAAGLVVGDAGDVKLAVIAREPAADGSQRFYIEYRAPYFTKCDPLAVAEAAAFELTWGGGGSRHAGVELVSDSSYHETTRLLYAVEFTGPKTGAVSLSATLADGQRRAFPVGFADVAVYREGKVVAEPGVRVRAEPNTDSKTLRTIATGETVRFNGRTSQFLPKGVDIEGTVSFAEIVTAEGAAWVAVGDWGGNEYVSVGPPIALFSYVAEASSTTLTPDNAAGLNPDAEDIYAYTRGASTTVEVYGRVPTNSGQQLLLRVGLDEGGGAAEAAAAATSGGFELSDGKGASARPFLTTVIADDDYGLGRSYVVSLTYNAAFTGDLTVAIITDAGQSRRLPVGAATSEYRRVGVIRPDFEAPFVVGPHPEASALGTLPAGTKVYFTGRFVDYKDREPTGVANPSGIVAYLRYGEVISGGRRGWVLMSIAGADRLVGAPGELTAVAE